MSKAMRITIFFIAALLSYGSLYTLIGPDKVRQWYHERSHYHRHWHDHHDHHENHEHQEDSADPSTGREEL